MMNWFQYTNYFTLLYTFHILDIYRSFYRHVILRIQTFLDHAVAEMMMKAISTRHFLLENSNVGLRLLCQWDEEVEREDSSLETPGKGTREHDRNSFE